MSDAARVSDPGRPSLEPRSVRFRNEREREWQELEDLAERALRRGLPALGEDELHRLPALYRGAVASLHVARQTAMDRALVRYLDTLVGRAYLAVYTSRKPERRALGRFFLETIPRSVRALGTELALSTAFMGLGVVVAYMLVRLEPTWYFAFVDESLAGGRTPGATTEFLRQTLYDEQHDGLSIFASFLFVHNAQIALLSFALGFAAGVPTAILLFTNGLMLGAFVALFHQHDLLVPLLGWLTPHGVPEIGALLLAGAGGFALGRAVLAPGTRSVRAALVAAGRTGAGVIAGAVALLLYAGVIEGVFRQTITDDALRFAVAAANATWLFVWLVLAGRGAQAAR